MANLALSLYAGERKSILHTGVFGLSDGVIEHTARVSKRYLEYVVS